MSDFWLGVVNLKNAKQLKNYKWRINANSVASQKMVEFLQDKRWKKRNRTNFYRVTFSVCINSIQFGSTEIFFHKGLIKFKIFCEYLVILTQ